MGFQSHANAFSAVEDRVAASGGVGKCRPVILDGQRRAANALAFCRLAEGALSAKQENGTIIGAAPLRTPRVMIAPPD
jgi:hypothetical protein